MKKTILNTIVLVLLFALILYDEHTAIENKGFEKAVWSSLSFIKIMIVCMFIRGY